MALKRILCATDFSSDATSALARAAMLAKEHAGALALLHVVSAASLEALRQWGPEPLDCPDRLVALVRQELEDIAANTARQYGIGIEPRLVVGEVTDSILAAAAQADLVVLGAHGMNPLKDAVLGTTAERMVCRTAAPTLVVRTPPRQSYRNVLVAVDLLPRGEQALGGALQIAREATLTAIHAYDVPFEGLLRRAGVSDAAIDEHRGRAHGKALEAIGELSVAVSGDALRFLAFVERGDAGARIVERQRTAGADLVVLLKRARSLGESLLLGSVTRHVLADVASDVLVLKEAMTPPSA
jgi:nucleotide-binding universal stress UspA family protein